MENWQRAVAELKDAAFRVFGPRLKRVVIFGSRARGTATLESDVDVLLVLDGPSTPGSDIDKIIDAVFEINLKYGELLAVVPVSSADYHLSMSPLLLNARREGIEA